MLRRARITRPSQPIPKWCLGDSKVTLTLLVSFVGEAASKHAMCC